MERLSIKHFLFFPGQYLYLHTQIDFALAVCIRKHWLHTCSLPLFWSVITANEISGRQTHHMCGQLYLISNHSGTSPLAELWAASSLGHWVEKMKVLFFVCFILVGGTARTPEREIRADLKQEHLDDHRNWSLNLFCKQSGSLVTLYGLLVPPHPAGSWSFQGKYSSEITHLICRTGFRGWSLFRFQWKN